MSDLESLAAEAARITSLLAEADEGDQRALREADERRATLNTDALDAIEELLSDGSHVPQAAESVVAILWAIGRNVPGQGPPLPHPAEPAYTVIGVFEDGPACSYQRFAEVFYTHDGPNVAEDLAREWAEEQDGEPEIIIAGVVRGEVGMVDALFSLDCTLNLVRDPDSEDPRFRTYMEVPEEGCIFTLENSVLMQYPLLAEGGWQTSGAAVDFDCAEAHAVPHLRQVQARLKKAMSE